MSRRPTSWPILLAVALALALTGCGKRGKLEPPEDAERPYSYPSFYPPPDTVNPETTQVRDSKDDPAGLGLEQTQPEPALSPLPPGRTQTETYGTPLP